jgi:hypothetical protein
VFNPITVGDDVEGDVEDMIGFVIGEVPLKQMEILVNVVDQPRLAREKEHGADAAATEALDAFGHFILNVSGSHHGLAAFRPWAILDAIEDSSLSLAENPLMTVLSLGAVASRGLVGDSRSHSKPLLL